MTDFKPESTQGILMQAVMMANSPNNPAMKVFIEHYAALVEKLTGTPAQETITLLTKAMEEEARKHREFIADDLRKMLKG